MASLRPVDQVVNELLGYVKAGTETESRTLDTALNCCAAADVSSRVNVPPADNSAMDGYAMAAEDAELNRAYPVSDRIPAGHIGKRLEPGTLARIFTGAAIPEGADTVVIQENTRKTDGGVALTQLPKPGDNVRSCGQDIASGSVVVRKGDRLTARSLGLLASVGLAELDIMKPLTVAVMSTGDELVEPGRPPAPGRIYNSNRYALAGMLKVLGFNVVDLGIVRDTRRATLEALTRGAERADVILASGGVSVGEEDHVRDAVAELGRIDVWKLAIKPGKPLTYGEVRGKPFFGLPGNPVSTFVTFQVVARPCLLAMQGYRRVHPETITARADFDFQGGSRREYLRVRLHNRDGATWAVKFPNQGSGIMTSVVWADGLAIAEAGREVASGDPITILPLTGI